jgi:hypothetical protein
MAKKVLEPIVIETTDVEVILIKEYQHPAGVLKPIGHKLIVTKEFAEELVGEGYAEILKN